MLDGATIESVNTVTLVRVAERQRGIPRVSAMKEFFVPRAETQLLSVENPARVPFHKIVEPPPTYSIPYPMYRSRYELQEALSESLDSDIIGAAQQLLKVIVPLGALGAVGGMVLAFSEALPAYFGIVGSSIATAVTFPPVALAIGLSALFWVAFQIRNENIVAEKAAAVRAKPDFGR